MCGIVGIAGHSLVTARLVDALKRLEYRGYDSAGLAVLASGHIERRRAPGKIKNLEIAITREPVDGFTGIAHTRWATHGKPSEANAHPHQAGRVSLVHNGIIENFRELRSELVAEGRVLESDTDSEVIAHLIDRELAAGLAPETAFASALARLTGAFAIAAVISGEDGLVLAARQGSPLAVGTASGETFVGSDALALAPFTRDVTYLEEGDWVIARPGAFQIRDASGAPVTRPVTRSAVSADLASKGEFRHFMEKEIHEQPESISRTIAHYLDPLTQTVALGAELSELLGSASRLVFTACGTAHYAAQVGRYWIEQTARIASETDIASEFRYRAPPLAAQAVGVLISQSGETADTLAALRFFKAQGRRALAIVNSPESTIAREADAIAPTLAGPEIGVASTKAFTAQLSVLAALAIGAARARGVLTPAEEATHVRALLELPRLMSATIRASEERCARLANGLARADHILYLGRGAYFPLALEGALKLKEISYIHAEGFAAGELKHGPIALIEEGTPVIIVAPFDDMFEKTYSNLQEVAARGARVILITDQPGAERAAQAAAETIVIPATLPMLAPILASAPLQLLAYHVAVLKGADVDQPRNLAKSVTVE